MVFRILSIDGGGIRGVIPAYVLAKLEKESSKQVSSHFDLIAGTSTGSIIAAAIALEHSMEEIVELYRNRGEEIFPTTAYRWGSRLLRLPTAGFSAPKYDGTGLDSVLKTEFKNKTLKDLKSPVLITTYNTQTRQSFVLKSWEKEYASIPVWEAVRASCSAPTYFPAFKLVHDHQEMPLIDGGVVANNPSACALAEAVRLRKKKAKDEIGEILEGIKLLSLGTGELTRPIPLADAVGWGAMEWAIPIIDVLFDGANDAADYVVSQILGPENYRRLQVRLDQGYDELDDASKTNINALISLAAKANFDPADLLKFLGK